MPYLIAEEPESGLRGQLADFGQFVGSWDITLTSIAPDGRRTKFVAEWHFGWVLNGRSIQDVLITRTKQGELVGYGTTVRTYDDRDGKWWIVWQDPLAHEFAVLYARPEGDTIMLEGQWPESPGARFRWVFSRITSSSFRWQGLLSTDDGATWVLAEEMDAQRRDRDGSRNPARAATRSSPPHHNYG
jgi:hypothetical protein